MVQCLRAALENESRRGSATHTRARLSHSARIRLGAAPVVEDAITGLHQSVTDGATGNVRLAGTGIADLRSGCLPAVQPNRLPPGPRAGTRVHSIWQGLEVEGCQCLPAGRCCWQSVQVRMYPVPDAAHVPGCGGHQVAYPPEVMRAFEGGVTG